MTTLIIYKEKTFYYLRHIHQCISSSLKGNMFACDQCQFKSGTKGILKIHITNLHKDIKYACDSCDHQTSTKSGLASPQETIHKQKKPHAGHVSTKQPQRPISFVTSKQYKKEKSTHAGRREEVPMKGM